MKCCSCAGAFDERMLAGSWLDRRCPLCGARLSEEAYDAAAAAVKRGRGSGRRRAALALARYYTSEWFRLACAGSGSEAPDKGLFGLRPGYDARGVFTLVPDDEDRSPEGGRGVSAEYAVFDAIRAEIARPGSSLAGAFLVPQLSFPWLPGQKPKQWGASQRGEVDCVLFTETCAVVVEVKRHGHHVRIGRDFQHIRECTATGSFRSSSEPVEQVERGADSLAERQRLYAPENILKAIVFVEPLSFAGGGDSFEDGWFVGCLKSADAAGGADGKGGGPDGRAADAGGSGADGGEARLLRALGKAVSSRSRIAGADEVRATGEQMLAQFGNTLARRTGDIVSVGAPAKTGRRTAAFLNALENETRSRTSPLCGARLLRNVVCEVEAGRRARGGKGGKGAPVRDARAQETKQVNVAGLLLTRSHAVFVDVRRWPVHVNTHAPFATFYTGDPDDGAECVEADIRHDWDLDEIGYRNRSGSLTLLTFTAKCVRDLELYRERNRVCTMHVFIDPASFVSDCDEFRSRTYLGFWRGREENVLGALAALEEGARPVMSQAELDAFADALGR